MRERPIQNLKKSAWCFQVEHSHFQYGVDWCTPETAEKEQLGTEKEVLGRGEYKKVWSKSHKRIYVE